MGSASQPPSLCTVLIVEDSEPCIETLEIALWELPDMTTVSVPSAEEALRRLESRESRICALVTDVHLKRMDGFELIRRVRSDWRYKRLPIVVISGDPDRETPSRALGLGADAFFEKPYSPAQVRQTLERLLYADPTESVP